MKVISCNVNGIRAFDRKGGVDRLLAHNADVVCLQEVRATRDQFVQALDGRLQVAAFVASDRLGRNGVAVCTSLPTTASYGDLPGLEGEGRWAECLVESAVGQIRVVSVYVPSGEVGTDRQELKIAFLTEMTARMQGFSKLAYDGGPETVVCGDINVARTDLDLKNWRGQRGRSGVLPQERAFLEGWATDGWADVAQDFVGADHRAPYTWWSMRGRAFDNNSGWRIDVQWATPGLAAKVTAAQVDRPPAYDKRWSDHAALVVDFAD